MATTRIKDKLSSIVASQLPEFIQNDYTTFVSFIEAYYKFLEQDQGAYEIIQNLRSYSDIDKTTSGFVKYFIKNYSNLLPQTSLADKKLLVKRIKDLYESKGSELSFELLFRILYNTLVTVNYPNEFILRASDGRWEQKVSIRVETTSGNRANVLNRLLEHTANNGVLYETPIIETRTLTSTLTELYLDPNKLAASYNLGEQVNVYAQTVGDLFITPTLVFSGNIAPTITDYTISTKGSGFKKGQVYTVGGGGIGTLIKVSNVDSSGGITEIKFIEYGYGYNTTSTAFSLDFDPDKNISESVDIISDTTIGFIESGQISTYNTNSSLRYFDTSDYVDTSYTLSDILSEFSSNSVISYTTSSNKPSNYATITFRLGGLARYPGSFTAVNGFLSEPEVRLQDNALYQPFAYQLNSDRDLSEFEDIVKSLIHPAGQQLFNNRIIRSNVDLSSSVVVSPTSNVFFEALDVIDIQDSIVVSKIFNKPVSDTANVEETLAIEFNSSLQDLISTAESLAFEAQTQLSSNTNVSESILIEKNTFKDSSITTESNTKINVYLTINTTTNTPTDDISGILVNYAEPGYFLETYAGEPVI